MSLYANIVTVVIRHARRLRLLALTIAAVTAGSSQNPPPLFDPPQSYYLALGDSIGYGYQAAKFRAGLPPAAYNSGYVDSFAARLREIRPGIKTTTVARENRRKRSSAVAAHGRMQGCNYTIRIPARNWRLQWPSCGTIPGR